MNKTQLFNFICNEIDELIEKAKKTNDPFLVGLYCGRIDELMNLRSFVYGLH